MKKMASAKQRSLAQPATRIAWRTHRSEVSERAVQALLSEMMTGDAEAAIRLETEETTSTESLEVLEELDRLIGAQAAIDMARLALPGGSALQKGKRYVVAYFDTTQIPLCVTLKPARRNAKHGRYTIHVDLAVH